MKKTARVIENIVLTAVLSAAVLFSGCGRHNFLYWINRAAAAKDPQTRINYYSEAIKKWRASDGSDRKSAVYNALGNLYFEKGDYVSAVGDYDGALKINSGDAGTHYNRGLAYYEKGDYGMVIKDFEKVIAAVPRSFEAYDICGAAYGKTGDFKKAVSLISRAIEINPKYAHAYYNRGVAFNCLGEYDSAIEDFGKAISLDNGYAGSYIGRATAYFNKRMYGSALKDYSKAIAADPRSGIAYNNAGYIYFDEGEYGKAMASFARAYGIDRRDWDSILGLALVNMKLKNHALTEKYFVEAAAVEPVLREGAAGLEKLNKKGYFYTARQKESFGEIYGIYGAALRPH